MAPTCRESSNARMFTRSPILELVEKEGGTNNFRPLGF